MKKLACLLLVIIFGLVGVMSRGNEIDTIITNSLIQAQAECQKIKPGMTRAEITKAFKEDTGGVAWPPEKPLPFQQHQTFDYRNCAIIKVDVDFSPSDSHEARPTDIITKISKPYLDNSPKI
jgi:hypothetical protein